MENCRDRWRVLAPLRIVDLQIESAPCRRARRRPPACRKDRAVRDCREGLGRPTGSMIMSTPRPSVDVLDAFRDFLAVAVDDVVGPEFAGKARLVCARYNANDFQLPRLWQDRSAHCPCRRPPRRSVPFGRVAGCKRIIEDVIGDLIVGERCRGIEDRQLSGKIKVASAGVAMILGIMAATMRPLARGGVNPLTDAARIVTPGPTFSMVPDKFRAGRRPAAAASSCRCRRGSGSPGCQRRSRAP